MRYRKMMFMLVIVIFIFGAASVSASDVDDEIMAIEDMSQVEFSTVNEENVDNLQDSESPATTQDNNDEEYDSEILSADGGTYSDLKNEIGNGGNINLTKAYYRYDPVSDSDATTIELVFQESLTVKMPLLTWQDQRCRHYLLMPLVL